MSLDMIGLSWTQNVSDFYLSSQWHQQHFSDKSKWNIWCDRFNNFSVPCAIGERRYFEWVEMMKVHGDSSVTWTVQFSSARSSFHYRSSRHFRQHTNQQGDVTHPWNSLVHSLSNDSTARRFLSSILNARIDDSKLSLWSNQRCLTPC